MAQARWSLGSLRRATKAPVRRLLICEHPSSMDAGHDPFEPFGIADDVRKALEAKGHRFADRPSSMGDVEAVWIDPATGIRWGASDPRHKDAGAIRLLS